MNRPTETDGEQLDIDLVRGRLQALMREDRLTQSRVSREVGVSSTTMSQFLSAVYAGDNDAVARKVNQWLESYTERTSKGGLPQAPEYAETPTSKKVIAGLRYAKIAQDLVLIYGGAGLGKTAGIEQYQRQENNVFVATMKPSTSTITACLHVICDALGLREYAPSAYGMNRAICARLRNCNALLVVDEAQHCNTQAVDEIRSIYDEVGCGVALVGNEQVFTRLTGGNRAAYLDRLYSRVGKFIRLPKVVTGDVDAIIAAWGIEDRACHQQIHEIAARPGALRLLTKVLRLAAAYAKADGKRGLCCNDIRAAWQELGA